MSVPGRSRAAALALLAGVVAVGGAAIISPIALNWTEKGNKIRAERTKTLRAEERESSRRNLIATGNAWTAFSRDPASGFSITQSDELAVEAARTRIEAAFSRFGGASVSVDADVSPAGRVGVNKLALAMRGSVPRAKLGGLLGALESEPPFLIIESFNASSETEDRLSLNIVGGIYRLEGSGQ